MTTETDAPIFDPKAFTADNDIPAADLERYSLDSYERKRRDGTTDTPYADYHIWLLPDTPMSLTTAAMELQASDDGSGSGSLGMAKLFEGLSQIVAGHDVPGLAQLYGDPEAAEGWPAGLVMHVYKLALSGEAPTERPNVSVVGRNGGSTRKHLARTTRS
jgi:hypothetical protein